MLKKILLIFAILFTPVPSHAAEMVNVEYIHKFIQQHWDITIPYNPALTNPKIAANMKYLLTAIDVANQKLNGKKTTDYGNGEYATMAAADTNATNTAVRGLIKKESKYPFSITTTPSTSYLDITIAAAGTFTIDWGDGTIEEIVHTETYGGTYSHSYASAGEYTIGFSGRATEYGDWAVMSFGYDCGSWWGDCQGHLIGAIDGSLGAIFPTIGDGSGAGQQPQFRGMFDGAYNLKKIPGNLFSGVRGAPVNYMFNRTFESCRGLTSIPENLFSGLSGALAENTFYHTFYNCSGLSGCIPDKLFANIDATLGEIIGSDGPFEGTNLVNCSGSLPDIESEFFITTTSGTSSFDISISAMGEFMIDWGDGQQTYAKRTNTTSKSYSHTYSKAGTYTIGIGGMATGYSTDEYTEYTAAISFRYRKIKAIDGSLGAVFPTIGDGSGAGQQPKFTDTFYDCSDLTELPENLFAGIHGAPVDYMFSSTFRGCSGLISIPAGLFAGIQGAPAGHMFADTFSGCSGLTEIPAGLFAGIEGAPASDMFYQTFRGCSGLTGIPSGLFAGIEGAPADSMFYATFASCSGLTEIPAGLFAKIQGAPASDMFYQTFLGCSGLTEIPAGLFAKIQGAPAASMFSSTFYGCSGLQEIPENLFAGIQGAPASGMFSSTFSGCSGLKKIPAGLFAGIQGAPARGMFSSTFYGCRGLTSIPSGLFAGIQGAPAASMFSSTFNDCSGLTGEIPAGFFGSFSGAPASDMFYFTFKNCSGLTGEIPANLFAGIEGPPAYGMFADTFNGCSGLTSIPAGLFAGIEGAPAGIMFSSTFSGCSGLTGEIPENLFAGIQGAPAGSMFNGTFSGCSGLTKIPENLFGNISGAAQYNMFEKMFYGCSSLSGESAKIGGKYLYEIWPNVTRSQVGYCYSGAKGLSDYNNMPFAWN